MGLLDYLSQAIRGIRESDFARSLREYQDSIVANATDYQNLFQGPAKKIIQHSPFGTGQPIEDIASEVGGALSDVAESLDPNWKKYPLGLASVDPMVRAMAYMQMKDPANFPPIKGVAAYEPGTLSQTVEVLGGEALEEGADLSNLFGVAAGIRGIAGKAMSALDRAMAASGVITGVPAAKQMIEGHQEDDYKKWLGGLLGTAFGGVAGAGLVMNRGAGTTDDPPTSDQLGEVEPLADFIEKVNPTTGRPYFTRQPNEVDYFNVADVKPFEIPPADIVSEVKNIDPPIAPEVYDRVQRKMEAERNALEPVEEFHVEPPLIEDPWGYEPDPLVERAFEEIPNRIKVAELTESIGREAESAFRDVDPFFKVEEGIDAEKGQWDDAEYRARYLEGKDLPQADEVQGIRIGQKPYAEQKFGFNQPVKVVFPDGTVHYDEVKGLNAGHAMARARANWEGAEITPATREEVEADIESGRDQGSAIEDNRNFIAEMKAKYGTRNWMEKLTPEERTRREYLGLAAYRETEAETNPQKEFNPIAVDKPDYSGEKWNISPDSRTLYDAKSGDRIETNPNGFLARSGSGIQQMFKTQKEAMEWLDQTRVEQGKPPREKYYQYRAHGDYKNVYKAQPLFDAARTSPVIQSLFKDIDKAVEPIRQAALQLFPNLERRINRTTMPGGLHGKLRGNREFIGITTELGSNAPLIHVDSAMIGVVLDYMTRDLLPGETRPWKYLTLTKPRNIQELGRYFKLQTIATAIHEMGHAADRLAVHDKGLGELRFQFIERALREFDSGQMRRDLENTGDDYEWGERAIALTKLGGKALEARGGASERYWSPSRDPFGYVSRERTTGVGRSSEKGSGKTGSITERSGIKVGETWYRKSDGAKVTITRLTGPDPSMTDAQTGQTKPDVNTLDYRREDGSRSANFEDNFLRDYSKEPPPKPVEPPPVKPVETGGDLPPVGPIVPVKHEPPTPPPTQFERTEGKREYPGRVARAILPTSNIIKKIDSLVDEAIKAYHKGWETAAGKFAYAAKVIGNALNTKQKLEVQKVLEGGTSNDPLVNKAARAVRALMDKIALEAERAGVFVGYMENYWPWKFEKSNEWEFDRYPTAFENLSKKQGNLEQHRRSEREDYRRDWDVLTEYFVEATRRIAEARTVGKNLEVVLPGGKPAQKHPHEISTYLERAIKREFGRQKFGASEETASKLRHLQALSDLGLVAIYQPSQFAHTAHAAGLNRAARAMIDVIGNFSKHELEALRSGALHANLTHEMSKAVATGKMSFMYGANAVDKFMRVHADHTGRLLIQDAIGGSTSAKRMLKNLMGEFPKEITPQFYDDVGKKLADKTNFRTGIMDMPLWSTHPLGRMITQYMSFAYQHTRFLVDDVIKPKNARRMLPFIVTAMAMGEVIGDARELIKALIPEDDKDDLTERLEKVFTDKKFDRKKGLEQVKSILYNRRIPWSHPAKRLLQNLTMIGGMGILQNILEKLVSPDKWQVPLGAVGSNVVEGVEAVSKDVGKQIKETSRKGVSRHVRRMARRRENPLPETSEWATRQVPIYGNRLANYLFQKEKRKKASSSNLPDVEPLYY